MKSHIWRYIIICLIVVLIVLLIPRIKDFRARINIEKDNQNLNFVGNDKGQYANSKAFILNDSSVLIASSLLNEPGTISLMKLYPDLKKKWELAWESKLSDPSPHTWFKFYKGKNRLTISDLKVIQDKCYIYGILEKQDKFSPVIITTTIDGKLISYQSQQDRISSHTSPIGIIMNNDAYFTWYNDVDKTVNLNKISLANPKTIKKSFIYLIQDSLRFTSTSSHPENKVVFFTSYDPHKGSSLISYTDKEGLRILNDTNKSQTLEVVSYINSHLYVVATNDTSVAVGLITPDIALDRVLLFNLPASQYTPKDLIVQDSTFYIGLNTSGGTASKKSSDALVLKYKKGNIKSGEIIIRGKKTDNLTQLLQFPDGELLAIGNSESHKFGIGTRVFATKFRL